MRSILLMAFLTGAAQAADLSVLSSLATKEVYPELVAQFEKESGHKVTTAWAGTVVGGLPRVLADLSDKPLAVADYYDMLINDAFANYRQILEDVTLHPAMGNYLDMRGNRAQYTNSSGQPIIPNENYAREVLQLFSIGLSELQPDGTLKLDSQGLAIPTYDQPVVQGFARVFTGLAFGGTNLNFGLWPRDFTQPMKMWDAYHDCDPGDLLAATASVTSAPSVLGKQSQSLQNPSL